MMIKRYLSRAFQIIALYPTRAIIFAIVITFLLSVTTGWNAWVSYRDFTRILTQEFRLQSLSSEIIYLDEALTMSARLNAATGDTQWEKRYLSFEPKLDAVIKELITLVPEVYEGQRAKQTNEANIKLVEMERKSFDLVRQGRKAEALSLLSSDAYKAQKQIYAQGNQVSILAIQNQIQLQLAFYQQEFLGIALVSLIRLFVIVPLWIIILQIVRKNLRDRKIIQENLQRSEERARATLLALPDLVFRVNHDGEYMDFLTSPQDKNLVDPYQLVDSSMYASLPANILPPHAETKYAAFQQALATQTVQTYEQQVWIDNKLRYEEVRVAACGNNEAVFFIRDISDRKQAELRLQQKSEQERLLKAITKQIRSSLNLVEILSVTAKEVRQVLQSDRVLICQLMPDGTGVAIAESIEPSRAKISNIIFPEGVIPLERYDYYTKGGIFVLNDREREKYAIPPNLIELLTKIQVVAVVSVPIPKEQALWGLLIAHQCDHPRNWQDWEINLLKQTANQLAIAIQQTSLFNQLQTELAERQWAEARLTETNAQLAIFNEELGRATIMKDEFLANMSHELRTPLNAILGMTEALKEEIFGSVNERQLKALETVERSSNHLLELINDILDIAKIESGQIELDCTLCAVSPLCQSSLAFVKQQALQKQIQLEVKLQLNLPNLLVDERRIRQALINLLSNAVKFTPEGGRIILEVSQLATNQATPDPPVQNFLRIAVIDTGIGISPEDIQKLFQPFIQIDSALNRQYQGTGLGLALVKRIVELHAGTVGLTSEVGVGSCFTIDLPCVSGAHVLPKITGHDPSASTPQLDSPQLDSLEVNKDSLILLVDDNEANLVTVSGYLEAKGYRLLLAKNGQEAIALAKADHPDLILMDIQMPVMDGLEATRQIRLDPALAEIPIIAMTALAMTGDRDRCLAAGANDYLAKPVKLKQLASTIQQLLAIKREHK